MASTHRPNRRRQARPRASSAHHAKTPAKAKYGKRRVPEAIFYAHALLIEREAAERYREFARHMSDHGDGELAQLFSQLAECEGAHEHRLAQKAAGIALPRLAAGEHAWIDQGAPLPEAHAFVCCMLTPRLALEIALQAGQRAKAFFEEAVCAARDPSIQALALDMARDEQSNLARVSAAREHAPQPYLPSEEQPGDPIIPQEL